MEVNYFEKKRSISLVIAIVLAIAIFTISLKFNDNFGIRYEFLIFFIFELFLLFYAIEGKRRKVKIIIWPIIVGIAYSVFDKSYGTVVLNRSFETTFLWTNITAILLSVLIYLLFVGHRKNVLWKGKDDGTHEKEIIELVEEKNKSTNQLETKDIEKLKEKIKESIEIDAEEKPAKKKKAIKKISTDKETEEESYFYSNNENSSKEEGKGERDLSEEVSEILDEVEPEDYFEEKKKDSSEGMSIDFEKEIEEEY